ncbi:MAG TPA: kelch repeat-containing protein, partial [Thermoanaerobaculia bacterium]
DRNRMIVLCSGNTIFEFDGNEWKDFAKSNSEPAERRFSGIAYDQKLKKVVLFGGFFNNNYRNDTWTWDGAKWQEVKIDNDDRPPHRGSIAMWYDPLQQKTIVYGGIGRPNINQKVTRFSDMWAFDGTRWTKLDVAQTPGIRFRPLVRVNPNTGKLLLFGGLRAEQIDEDSIRQYFDNDTWEWDGSTNKWTELSPATQPPPRQNGGLAHDPLTNELVMFGGYANGFYLSDVWAWNGTNWYPRLEAITNRRRSVR